MVASWLIGLSSKERAAKRTAAERAGKALASAKEAAGREAAATRFTTLEAGYKAQVENWKKAEDAAQAAADAAAAAAGPIGLAIPEAPAVQGCKTQLTAFRTVREQDSRQSTHTR